MSRRTPARVYRFRRYDPEVRAGVFGRRDLLREMYLEALGDLLAAHEARLPHEMIIRLERIAIDAHRRQLLGGTQKVTESPALSRLAGRAMKFGGRAPKPQRMLPSPVEDMISSPGSLGRKSGGRQS